ncbi:MAG: VWA domain-containing protein [Gammaproteobacteria bacterium]|nr:VWA domain-containing protein [Gammaproteobacteria bacterium]
MPKVQVRFRTNFIILLVIALLVPLAVSSAPTQKVQLNLDLGQNILPADKGQKSYMKIGLEGFLIPTRKHRPPINVALVLDRSGSMRGEKIRHAKEAAIMALSYLQRDDTLSVVVYDHRVRVLVPSAPFHDRASVERAIRSINVNGKTALHAGVTKGASELRKYLEENRVNRIILLSDGLANVGPRTPAQLGRLGSQLGGDGMSITTIGLGLGYNEDLMVRLAGASDGNHVFAESPSELATVFRNEFGELTSVVAGDVIIIIQCRNGVRPLRALGREVEIKGNKVKARLNQLYSKQEKYLLLEVETPAGKDGSQLDLADVEVSYNNLVTKQNEKLHGQVQISYSASADRVENSINKKVMVSASEQIGADMDDRVLEMKDKGDTRSAAAILREKASYLSRQAKKYQSKRLEDQSVSASEAENAVTEPASSAAWGKMRKKMRADQYSIKQQQSYR